MAECIAKYDIVYVGFPIWWGREPSVVDTFLSSGDFKGKRIIPFCTSGGSGMGETAARMSAWMRESVLAATFPGRT